MSFPRYPKYKDSGVEWLGEVPEHWDIRRLKFLCDIQTGDKDTENAVEDGTFPFFVRSQTVERINSCSFDCEAILTAGDGAGVGKVFHYHKGPFDFHQRVYMLNKFRDVSGPFLFHFLRENFYKVALEGGAKSTVDSLRRPLFTNFPIAIPPDDEQQFVVGLIAAESQKIDELVAEQRRLIELLKEKRQAVISHAVTKGLNPNVPMKPSGIEWLGEVPEHWAALALKRITSLKSGDGITAESIQETGEYPVLGGNGLRGYTSRFTHDGHYVVIGRQGALCGNINYARGKFWASEHAVVAAPLRPVSTEWLGEMLRAMNLNQHSVSAAQPGLSMEFVGNLRTVFPPIAEQNRIAEFLGLETTKSDALTAEAERAIDLLQERRTALISAAVTGKIDVRGWVNAEGA